MAIPISIRLWVNDIGRVVRIEATQPWLTLKESNGSTIGTTQMILAAKSPVVAVSVTGYLSESISFSNYNHAQAIMVPSNAVSL